MYMYQPDVALMADGHSSNTSVCVCGGGQNIFDIFQHLTKVDCHLLTESSKVTWKLFDLLNATLSPSSSPQLEMAMSSMCHRDPIKSLLSIHLFLLLLYPK